MKGLYFEINIGLECIVVRAEDSEPMDSIPAGAKFWKKSNYLKNPNYHESCPTGQIIGQVIGHSALFKPY